MAGLLQWAADVVGGGGAQADDEDSIPIVFTAEQLKYARELDSKASYLSRSIQDLRLRLPPADISQRLPHLHAHSIASNADLALQLNAHSATKEQVQLREATLLEENAAYEKAISTCQNKIQEKIQEADILITKLKEMDEIEWNLKIELENAQNASEASQSGDSSMESRAALEDGQSKEDSKSDLLEKLESKKIELSSMEEIIQSLDKKWAQIQENASKWPSPAQREKTLDKQLHSLIEQLAAKQAQAEGLVSEIHLKEKELERLNGLWRGIQTSNGEVNNARNRLGRSSSTKGFPSSDYIGGDGHQRPPFYIGGRTEAQQRLMLLRSAFVLYVLALNIVVFIKISV